MKRNLIFLILVAIISILAISCGDPEPGGSGPWEFTFVVEARDGASGIIDGGFRGAEGSICRSTCRDSYADGTEMFIYAVPGDDSYFVGWRGPCTGTDPLCVFNIDSAGEVKAIFAKNTGTKHLLTVTKTGTGTGTVKDGFIDGHIDCGSQCSIEIAEAAIDILFAVPDADSVFVGWSGACSGGPSLCIVTMNEAKNVTAEFKLKTTAKRLLKVEIIGSGVVKSQPEGIECGINCSKEFPAGSTIRLTATAEPGFHFVAWEDACSGSTNPCTVTMSSAKRVLAKFEANTTKHKLEVKVVGFGVVKAVPAGIECGTDCEEDYPEGSFITLTATADTGSVFVGWEDACTGTGNTCVVTMTEAKLVTARFDVTRKLTVDIIRVGSGNGVVTSFSPDEGINCGADCTEDYANGKLVKLKVTEDAGSRFVGWGGACSGTGVCEITMNTAKHVTAKFSSCFNPVAIPDLFLRIFIKSQLGISGTITCEHLETMTKLDSDNSAATLNSKKVTSLEGLQYAANLEILKLSYNKITSISQLSSLKKLHTVYLDHNNFSNVDALKVLINLKQLRLNNNNISTIVALVDNSGLSGSGDFVTLEQNCLILDPFAADSDKPDIDSLITRGVNVTFSPQRLPKTCP